MKQTHIYGANYSAQQAEVWNVTYTEKNICSAEYWWAVKYNIQ